MKTILRFALLAIAPALAAQTLLPNGAAFISTGNAVRDFEMLAGHKPTAEEMAPGEASFWKSTDLVKRERLAPILLPNGTQIIVNGTSPGRDIQVVSPEIMGDFDHSHFYYVYTMGYTVQTKQYYLVQQFQQFNTDYSKAMYPNMTVVEPPTGLAQSFNGSTSSGGGTYIFWYVEPGSGSWPTPSLQVFTYRNGQYAFQPPISF